MLVHKHWLLTPERAAVHLPTATAVIADLHLGYQQARRRGGDAIPAVGLDDTIAALSALYERNEVRSLIIAGDLHEDGRRGLFPSELLTWLRDAGLDLAGVVPGNHDRGLRGEKAMAIHRDGMTLGGWRIVHGDGKAPRQPCVQGHLHPVFRWGEAVSAPCFLIGERRIILPAFSDDTAGLNVLRGRRWSAYRCGVIAGDEVLDFGMIGDLLGVRSQKSEIRGQMTSDF